MLRQGLCSTHDAMEPAQKAISLSHQKDLVRKQGSIWNQKANKSEKRTQPHPGEANGASHKILNK